MKYDVPRLNCQRQQAGFVRMLAIQPWVVIFEYRIYRHALSVQLHVFSNVGN